MINIPKCEKCKKRKATDIHHRDGNHNNDEEKNLQFLCAICHTELHNIPPKKSELKRLIILRDRIIKQKIVCINQIKGFSRIEYVVPKFWKETMNRYNKKIKELEKEIKKLLESEKYPVYDWLIHIRGINFITSAKLISHIDIKNTPTISALWRYCGLDATHIKRRRKMSKEEVQKCGNPYLKRELLGILGNNFIRQKTPIYREIYNEEKEKQLNNNGISKIHAHRRARRKMVKIFISHFWVKWRELEGLSMTNPWIIDRGGHNNYISP